MTTKEKPLPKPQTHSEALAIFQSKVKSADRTGTAKETRKDKKTNQYVTTERKYSTLEDVIKAIQPAAELGISHTQTFDYIPLGPDQLLTVLTTTLYFKDEKLESKLPLKELKSFNVMHDLGIAITYTRRYALGAAYGIGSEIDDDAMSLNQSPPPKKGTATTPTKPNQELAPVSEKAITDPPISREARTLLLEQLQSLDKSNPDKMKELVESFRNKFGIKDTKISRHITTALHGEFLSHAISKIDDTL